MLFVILGLIVIAVTLLRRPRSKDPRGSVKGGAVIMIGPIPIIFGTDKKSVKIVLLLSITLTVIVLFTIIVSYFLSR